MRRWFAAQAIFHLERTTEHHLNRAGFGFFAPAFIEKDVVKGRRQEITVRLFPGYVFVEFDLDVDYWQEVNSMPGIVKLLPLGLERPLPLPEGFVEETRERIVAGEFTAPDAERMVRRYVKDELLVVTGGPFEYCSGRYVRRHKGSIILLMYLLGRATEIPVPSHLVRS